eukprot:4438975-Pyramimonas_sp.AAC.1
MCSYGSTRSAGLSLALSSPTNIYSFPTACLKVTPSLCWRWLRFLWETIALGATCCTYADDRTAMTSTAEDMQHIQQEWDHLESLTALRTNHAKT